jgi:hypothetical protein
LWLVRETKYVWRMWMYKYSKRSSGHTRHCHHKLGAQCILSVFSSRELHCWQTGINMAITFVCQHYWNMLHAGPIFLVISEACTDLESFRGSLLNNVNSVMAESSLCSNCGDDKWDRWSSGDCWVLILCIADLFGKKSQSVILLLFL